MLICYVIRTSYHVGARNPTTNQVKKEKEKGMSSVMAHIINIQIYQTLMLELPEYRCY